MTDPDLEAQLHRVRLESDTLYAVIVAVGSSLDLDRVLDGIVELLTKATGCHACFVYLRDGDRLRMRAASRVYAHLVGRIEMGIDEGVTGWAARTGRPALIREDALADPRMKFFAELEEERFQSMAAVPVPARSGKVIGVLVLHTVAPREFDEGELNVLVHTASLVAGAIENAQLYEGTRRRVETLTALSALSRDIAAARTREELYPLACARLRALLRADLCQLFLFDGERLALAATDPPDAPSPWGGADSAAMLLDLLRQHEPELRSAPLTTGDEDLGVLVASGGGEEGTELLRAVANQVAVALKKLELIERLTAESIVRDLFEAMAAGAADAARARAEAAGCDLDRPHALVHVEGAGAERVEAALRRLGALTDAGRESLRALVPADETLRDALDELARAEGVAIGISGVRRGAEGGDRSLREAADAARIARALRSEGGALAYGDLGAYRYLVRLPAGEAPRDRHWEAVERLVEYDRRRRTELLGTLEQYLRDRRSITTTARALYVHPNTLRQRLDRIEKLTGLDLDAEDLLSLELAIKLARLA